MACVIVWAFIIVFIDTSCTLHCFFRVVVVTLKVNNISIHLMITCHVVLMPPLPNVNIISFGSTIVQ